MTKILVLGASGFLGTKLITILKQRNEVVGTYKSQKKDGLYHLDINNKNLVNLFFNKIKPEIVLHTAAISRTNKCESNKDLALKTNVEGTRNVVNACIKINSRLIFFSTLYVFNDHEKYNTEIDKLQPANFYGKTKAMAERLVLSLKNSIILRMSLLYGYNEPNSENGFFSLVINPKNIQFDNQWKKHPLFVEDVAEAIQFLLKKRLYGIYHLAGQDSKTLYELATALEKIVREKSILRTMESRNKDIKKPNILLCTSKIQSLGFRFHSLAKSLVIIKKQYDNAKIGFKT